METNLDPENFELPDESYVPGDECCVECGRAIDFDEHNYGTEDMMVCIQCYSLAQDEMELTDRELALRWWNRKSIQERTELAILVDFPVENRDFNTLSGNEVEWIWRNQPYNS